MTVNQLDGVGRELQNVQSVRAHFIDLDNLSARQNLERAKAFNPAPAFAVQSSDHKFHVYWPVQPYQDNEKFTLVQRKLAQLFDGDPTIIDATRVMRLPGTLHQKGEPVPVTCFSLGGYGLASPAWVLQAALGGVQVVDGGTGQRHALGDPELAASSWWDAALALDLIDPNDLGRGEWLSVTAAFKQAAWTHKTQEEIKQKWLEWCARYSGDDTGENHKQWESIRDTQLGWKSLHHKAHGKRAMPAVDPATLFGDQQHQLPPGASTAPPSGDQRTMRMIEDKEIGDDLRFPVVPEILTLDEMLKDFVFLGTGSHVVSRKTKTVRKLYDATNEYAASTYTVETGEDEITTFGSKKKTKTMPAIKAWMTSHARLSVDTIAWSPGDSEMCRSPERTQGGDRAYNLWSGFRISPPPNDWLERVQPFLNHVEYLVPVQDERVKFLKWCAHIFQHPGVLPHTCYLMITETAGIGRGTLGSMLTRALRGYVAANMDVAALFGGFNGRISQKLLATVDEIREGNSHDRYAKQQSFKSAVVQEFTPINPKYGYQSVEKNCCRWLMFSNHHDALPFDNTDRRVIVIANPTFRQSPEYYTWLNGLLSDAGFIASIQQYLMTLDLSGFNAGANAPMNDAKMNAIKSLESQADRDANQFVEQWPGELATVTELREFMGEDAPSGRALGHVVERAGMKSAHKQKVNGKTQTILIVRGELTPDALMTADKMHIAKLVSDSANAFRGQN